VNATTHSAASRRRRRSYQSSVAGRVAACSSVRADYLRDSGQDAHASADDLEQAAAALRELDHRHAALSALLVELQATQPDLGSIDHPGAWIVARERRRAIAALESLVALGTPQQRELT